VHCRGCGSAATMMRARSDSAARMMKLNLHRHCKVDAPDDTDTGAARVANPVHHEHAPSRFSVTPPADEPLIQQEHHEQHESLPLAQDSVVHSSKASKISSETSVRLGALQRLRFSSDDDACTERFSGTHDARCLMFVRCTEGGVRYPQAPFASLSCGCL
jgi:hypothetical protein